MPKNAYCAECGTRVTLNDADTCPNGHPRSALRDVRDGALAPPPVATGPAVRTPSGSPAISASELSAAKLIGRLVIIIPSILVVAFGLYTGYAASLAMGMTKSQSWLSSIGSMLVTGLSVWAIVWVRRRKQNL